jgi:hypothetical protein
MKRKRLFVLLSLVALFFLSSAPAPARSQLASDPTPAQVGAPVARQSRQATDDAPVALSSGYVNSFTVADPVAYWHTAPGACPQGLSPDRSASEQAVEPSDVYAEGIGRTPT